MASYRQLVPLREAEIVKVQDGTMCRMPSPRPGPLRGNVDALANEEKQNVLQRSSKSSETIVKLASLPAVGSAA
jgi:hypothetical protein